MVLVLLVLISFQEKEDTPNPRWVAFIGSQLRENIGFELTRVKRFHGLSQADADEIAERMEEAIVQSARRYAKAVSNGKNRPQVLDANLSNAFSKHLQIAIGAEAAGKWLEDVAVRRQFWVDALLDGTMVMLDDRVAFTSTQQREVRAILEKEWKLAAYYSLSAMKDNLRPFDSTARKSNLPEGFPEDSVLTVLTKSQKTAWATHSQRMADVVAQESVPPAPLRTAEPLALMQTLLRERAEILAEQYKLNQTEARKLQIAAKGAALSAHRARVDTFAVVNEKRRLQPNEWAVYGAKLPALVIWHSRWFEMAHKALPRKHRQAFKLRMQERTMFTHAAFAKYLTADLTSWRLLLSAEGQQAFFQQLCGVPTYSNGGWLSPRSYGYFIAISDDAWAKILTEPELKWTTRWLDTISRSIFGKER